MGKNASIVVIAGEYLSQFGGVPDRKDRNVVICPSRMRPDMAVADLIAGPSHQDMKYHSRAHKNCPQKAESTGRIKGRDVCVCFAKNAMVCHASVRCSSTWSRIADLRNKNGGNVVNRSIARASSQKPTQERCGSVRSTDLSLVCDLGRSAR